MAEHDVPVPASEAEAHARGDIPDSEKAREIGPEPDADLHGDPDDPDPTPSATEAAEVAQWRVAKCLLALRTQINALAPNRGKASDGTVGDTKHQSRKSDHNPWVRDGKTGVVTAMDITHDPAHACDASTIAQALIAGKDPRIKYIIWNKRIANASAVGGAAAWTWRPYSGANPHTRHIHISVKPDKASYDDQSAWSLPASLGTVATS